MTLFRQLLRVLSPPSPKRIARERFVLPHEWLLIRPVLASKPQKISAYFQLLFLTGARRDEARTAQWCEFDLDAGLWHKRRTKNGKRHLLPLAPETVNLLKELPRHGPYLFHGAFRGGTNDPRYDRPVSVTTVEYWWRQIRLESGCPDVRIHDLRRSTGSWMAIAGENMKVVQSALGHSDIGITSRHYAHLDLRAVREAVSRLAGRVLARNDQS